MRTTVLSPFEHENWKAEAPTTEGGKTKIAELMSDFFGFLLGSFTKSISGS